MKLLAIVLLLLAPSAFANYIDDKCNQFVYKYAPEVAADTYICYKQFGVAYSYTRKTPIYTVEFLESKDLGEEERTNNFRPDPKIPYSKSATNKDYVGSVCFGDPCDKGHMVPAQNLSSCKTCGSESFYFTNIIPQNSKNNRGAWKSLETRVRNYVNQVDPVYIVTGPIYHTYEIIGKGVAVPSHLFKVIINPKTNESISFLMENKGFPSSSLNGKVVPLNTIEKHTGISFPKILNKEKSASYQKWFSGL